MRGWSVARLGGAVVMRRRLRARGAGPVEYSTGERDRRCPRARGATRAEITIPADRARSCVDILRWYLDEARATCEAWPTASRS